MKIVPFKQFPSTNAIHIGFTANHRPHFNVSFPLWLKARCKSTSKLSFLSVNLFPAGIIMLYVSTTEPQFLNACGRGLVVLHIDQNCQASSFTISSKDFPSPRQHILTHLLCSDATR